MADATLDESGAEPGVHANSMTLLLLGFAIPFALRGYFGAWQGGDVFVQVVLGVMGIAGVSGATDHAPARRSSFVATYGYVVVGVIANGLVLTSMQTMTPYITFAVTSLVLLAKAPAQWWKRALLALALVPSVSWAHTMTIHWLPGGVVPAVFDADAAEVIAFDLAPSNAGSTPLLTDPVSIGDRDTVARVVEILASAEHASTNHAHTNWEVVFVVRYEDRVVRATVAHTNQGVLVYVDTPSGFRLTKRRADDLGPIIEALAEPR